MRIPKTTRAQIDRIVRQIVDAYQPDKVILFGSYAYGEPHSDSDLDLLIIKKTSEGFIDRWISVRQIVSDPDRSIPFEPIVLTPEELKERLAIARVERVIERLSKEPRPAGCQKLSGFENQWRVRVGDYRILYVIDDKQKEIRIARIAHRREAYR